MTAQTNEDINNSATPSNGASTLADLPDAQVFSRDAEAYTTETTADTIRRLARLVERQRKARQDSAEIADLSTKLKKANAATKKKKAVKPLSMETII